MRLNSANRTFVALSALAAVPYVLLGFAGCTLVGAVAYALYVGGWSAITAGSQDLRPALVFFAILAVGAVLGAASLAAQVRASARLAARVRSLRMSSPPVLREVARRARVEGLVDVIDSAESFSFTYGVASPRIAISRNLLESLAPAEVEAVLAHERYHVRARDPAKILLVRTLLRAAFYLPALRDLRHRYVAGRELAADRVAVRACGDRALAAALYKVVAGPSWPELGQAAAISDPNLLVARVAQLETGVEPPIPSVTLRAKIGTALALLALAALLGLALAGLDDPFAFAGDRAWGREGSGDAVRHDGRPGFGGFFVSSALWIAAGRWLWRRRRLESP